MPDKLSIILCLTALGVGGTILIFFLFRICIRKAALSKRRFVSVPHLILLALPVTLFFLQDLKVLPMAWPNFIFWIIGVATALLSLGFNVRLWGWGYRLAFTLCEIFSSLALITLIAATVYTIAAVAILVIVVGGIFMSIMRESSQLIQVSDSPLGTDCFYVRPVNHGGFMDSEGNYYTSISSGELLSSDGSIYYIID